MMHWFDYGAILLAVVIALWADYDARVAYRSSIAVFIRDESALQDWIRTYDLRQIFGPPVYAALRHLHQEGVVERKVGGLIDHAHNYRGEYENVWYRWKDRKGPSA